MLCICMQPASELAKLSRFSLGLTELMAMTVSCWVTGLVRAAATTQHPQPPSPHIFLVPVSPGWARRNALREREGDTPWTSTGAPFRVKETDVLGSTDELTAELELPIMSDHVIAPKLCT